jgi:hypothetical protein
MAENHDDLMAQVSGMAPEVAEAFNQQEALFAQPRFQYSVDTKSKIPGATKMNGTVSLKYPNFGEDLKIERATNLLGGGNLALMKATLLVCIERAPSTWYEFEEGASTPVLNLDRLPDDSVLADLYRAFTDWQRSFR